MHNALRSHIEAKVADAVLDTSPFPHFIVEKFFPDDIYKDILRYNPFKSNHGQEWLDRQSSANVSSKTPYYARKQINFHKDDVFNAPPAEQQFWKEIKDCFLSDNWFVRLVFSKYPDYFIIRYGDLTKESDFFSLLNKEFFLQRHEPGFYIGPHTDIPTRVFTCIFSFAEREGFEEYGTQLLAHKDRLTRCWGCDHYTQDNFIVKKVAPYKPNNVFLFFKTRQSFHSVRAITDEVPNQRYGMQFQYWEQQGGLLRDLSVPQLMHFRRYKADKDA
jgi:hypothetical protein